MKKIVGILLMVVMMLLLLSSCGIPQDEYDTVVAERDKALAEVESLETDLSEVESQIDTLESDLDSAQSQISSLQSDLRAAQAKIAELAEIAPRMLYKDDFSNLASGWSRASFEDCEYDYEDDKYYILVMYYDWAVCVWNRNAGQFTDFALEIDASPTSGPKDIKYGVIFRAQYTVAENYYRFLISGDGYYLVGTKTHDKWTTLHSWTKSAFIKEGNSTNHLKVVCRDSQIVVYVNGYHLTTITDVSFAKGCVGMIVDTSEPNSRVTFDNITVYSLD